MGRNKLYNRNYFCFRQFIISNLDCVIKRWKYDNMTRFWNFSPKLYFWNTWTKMNRNGLFSKASTIWLLDKTILESLDISNPPKKIKKIRSIKEQKFKYKEFLKRNLHFSIRNQQQIKYFRRFLMNQEQ